jgi:hypothetical protein
VNSNCTTWGSRRSFLASERSAARGRSERSFGTWQGRLPQELGLAGITTVEGANAFLRGQYIGEFNAQFRVPSQEKGTAFRRTSRTDLNWIFTVQTERVVAKDNTVAIGSRLWQIEQRDSAALWLAARSPNTSIWMNRSRSTMGRTW